MSEHLQTNRRAVEGQESRRIKRRKHEGGGEKERAI
jgi:hypothetical protein